MEVIFLDIDGVLNTHIQFENGYNGIESQCVLQLNNLMDLIPDSKIVIISAWRYMILSKSMTIRGFENLLLSHGINCYDRVIGNTSSDESQAPKDAEINREWFRKNGILIRGQQIKKWIIDNDIINYVILDDLDLGLRNQIIIDGKLGLTAGDVEKAFRILNENKN